MTGNNQTQKFFQYLQELQYHTIIEFALQKLLIALILLNVFTPQVSLFLFLCLLFANKYKFSFVDLAKSFDRRYDCSDQILSTYYLTKESPKTIFYAHIISQAITQLQKYLPQERARIGKIYLQHGFIITVAAVCLGINTLPSTQKSLPSNQKKILRISAKKIQKIAKNIEMMNEKDAEFLKDVAKTWQQADIQQKDIAKSLQQLQSKLQKIRDKYKKQAAERNALEQLTTLSPKNKQRMLEKAAQHLPHDIHEKIRKHIENNELQEALQVYKSSVTKLPTQAIQEAQNLINKLSERLLTKKAQIKTLVNSTEPFETEASQQEFQFSKANVIPTNQGWETINYPSKYHAIVHSYLDERNKNEEK